MKGHAASDANQTIVVVERNAFLRDCLLRSVTHRSHSHAIGCATLGELKEILSEGGSWMALLSTLSLSDVEKDEAFERLANFDPRPLTMVLAKSDDPNSALLALRHGANGYISMSSGFENFIQALRFVGAGGTYVPAHAWSKPRRSPRGPKGLRQVRSQTGKWQ